MRYHRNFLRGAKDRVYSKIVFPKFLEHFTSVISFFYFTIHFLKILSKNITHNFRGAREAFVGSKYAARHALSFPPYFKWI